jgi:diguanylate cyclase (GGDEF)-like protein/PAS domain S-box-containing protein
MDQTVTSAARDFTERQLGAELPKLAAAFGQQDGLVELLDQMSDGVYLVDRRRTIRSWNRACERITGYSADEVVGRRCFENILQHVDDEGRRLCVGLCPLAHTMRDGAPRMARVWLHHKLGHRVPVHVSAKPVRDHGGRVIGAVETFCEDSAPSALADRIAELEQLAMVDPLTAVPNRRFLELTLSSRLAEVRRHGAQFVVAYGDVDRFKRVNDVFGHDVGDRALRMVAATLTSNLRGSDAVARVGGEEFVVLLNHASADTSLACCERLRRLVASSSLDIAGGDLSVTISFGVTLTTPDDSPEAVLRRADALLYQSKRAGGDLITTDLD